MAAIAAAMDADLSLIGSLNATTQKNFNRPEADAVTWNTVALVPEAAPVYQGYPTKPLVWFSATPQLTTNGTYVLGTRPNPDDVSIGADLRWLPTSSTWSASDGTWGPFQATNGTYRWTSVITTRPTLGSATYRLRRELITVPVLTFAPGQYLISDFALGTAGATSWSMSFVAMLSAPRASAYPLLDWGIPGWDQVTPPPPTRTYLHVGEKLAYGWADAQGTVDPIVALSSMTPAFIVLVVSPPLVKAYVSTGNGFTFRTSGSSNAPARATQLQFYLGRSPDLTMTQGQFSLCESAFWARALTEDEITQLVSNYGSVYGAR